jgi:hypothetical protein
VEWLVALLAFAGVERMTHPFYVYEHLRADTLEVFYVGKGKGKRARCASRHHRSEWWQRVAAKAGGFEVHFVAVGLREEDAFALEVERIAELRRAGVPICNLTNGGDGTSGWIKSPEWRRKIGDAHRGKVISAETRAKISASVKACGFVHSEEQRRRISESHRGHCRGGWKQAPEWIEASRSWTLGNKSRTGQKQTEAEIKKRADALRGRPKPIAVCPHCGKAGGVSAMTRWHFDHCREKQVA